MPPKKRKLAAGQQTLSGMFAQKSAVNVTTEESTGDARETESKQHFLINLMVVQVQDEIECGIDWTLSFDLNPHFISGTSSNQIVSESEIEIDCAQSSASTSRASTSTRQSENVDIVSSDSNDDDAASETLNVDFYFKRF